MLREAGVEVPTTWDELRNAAKVLTKEQVSGFAFCSLQNEEGTFKFALLIVVANRNRPLSH